MKKITELTEKRFRTSYVKDANGNRTKKSEEVTATREVKTVESGPRFGHFIIDGIAYNIIAIGIDYAFQTIITLANIELINLTFSLFYNVLLLLIYPLMYFACEFIWQKTPGKYLTETIVIDEYGNKPSLNQLILRSLIRIVPFEPFSCLDKNSRGWHDKWSNTFVVKNTELAELKKLQLEQETK